MISFEQACDIAKEYYKQKLNINGLAKALKGDDRWFFSGGTPGELRVGNTIISVNETNGEVCIVDLPSKENFALLRKAVPVELPK